MLCYADAQPSAVVGSTETRQAARVHHFRQLEAFKVFSIFNLLEKLRMPNFASHYQEKAQPYDLDAVAFPVFPSLCASKTQKVINKTLFCGLQVYCGAVSGSPRGCRCFAHIRAVFSPSGCASKDAHLGDSGNGCAADGRPKAEAGGWQGSDWQSIRQTGGVRCLKQWACC